MERQLLLLDDRDADWQLDDETRAIGRRGIEAARAALRSRRATSADPSASAAPKAA